MTAAFGVLLSRISAQHITFCICLKGESCDSSSQALNPPKSRDSSSQASSYMDSVWKAHVPATTLKTATSPIQHFTTSTPLNQRLLYDKVYAAQFEGMHHTWMLHVLQHTSSVHVNKRYNNACTVYRRIR